MITYLTFAFVFLCIDASVCIVLRRKFNWIGSMALCLIFPLAGACIIYVAATKTKNFPSMDKYIDDLEHR